MRHSMTIRLENSVLAAAKQIAKSNNRTLTNYIETLIQKDIAIRHSGLNLKVQRNEWNELFKAYSSGKITLTSLEEQTCLWFSEILEELGKRGLKLPIVDSLPHYNAKQRKLYEEIFGKQNL